jgi:hypothetical protein
MMRATADAAATVRALIAAIPEQCLRDLCLQLAINSLATPPATSPVEPGARRKGGWPRGRPRRTMTKSRRRETGPAKNVDPKLAERRKRYEAKRAAARRAARHDAKAAEAAKVPQPTTGNGNAEDTPITADAFWQRCEQIEPKAPWRVPMREFDVKNAVAQQAFRARTLPPRIGAMAISRFLELQAS